MVTMQPRSIEVDDRDADDRRAPRRSSGSTSDKFRAECAARQADPTVALVLQRANAVADALGAEQFDRGANAFRTGRFAGMRDAVQSLRARVGEDAGELVGRKARFIAAERDADHVEIGHCRHRCVPFAMALSAPKLRVRSARSANVARGRAARSSLTIASIAARTSSSG